MGDEQLTAMRATAHPLRLRMLSLLTGTAMSAAEVARELDITHANASYHLRVLHDAELLVVESEEVIRGGVAKRYRHPWRDIAVWESHDGGGRVVDVSAVVAELTRRLDARLPDSPLSLCDAELWVDPDTWEQVRARMHEAAELLHDAAVAPRSAGAVHVNLTSLAFELPGDESGGPGHPTAEHEDGGQ